MKKGISVIIPTFNREKFVAEAIQSVLNQEYDGHVEIIISDDGSSDNTVKSVRAFKNKVILLTKPIDCKTQGASSTRNRGIKVSTQPFICFLDSDDLYLKNHLKKMILPFQKKPELGFAFCRSLEFKVENDNKLFRPWTRNRIFNNDVKNPVVSRKNIVNTNSFIFRREVFEKVGFFNEEYSNGEDGDQWMRISEQYKGIFLNHFGTAYRTQHEIEQLTKNSNKLINNCLLLIYENAKTRYYNLHIKDNKRIFNIKYVLIWLKYREDNITLFIFNYLKLIFRYPSGFLQKLINEFFQKQEKRKRKNWNNLENFI